MNEITHDMLEELNDKYNDAIFEFIFNDDCDGVVDIKMKSNCQKHIDSYIVKLCSAEDRLSSGQSTVASQD